MMRINSKSLLQPLAKALRQHATRRMARTIVCNQMALLHNQSPLHQQQPANVTASGWLTHGVTSLALAGTLLVLAGSSSSSSSSCSDPEDRVISKELSLFKSQIAFCKPAAENPIQSVKDLLHLYQEIDQNMQILSEKMVEELQKKIEQEKQANNGQLQLSVEQRALNMSIEFETTLEKVQDAVFRNHYVTKEQVQQAIQNMIDGRLPGEGYDGQVSIQEAEAIEQYVKRLARMRWLCTGSREPLIGASGSKKLAKPAADVKLKVDQVISVMEEVVPRITQEMEKVLSESKQQPKDQQRAFIDKQYIQRSAAITQQICAKHNVDVQEFQAALFAYHEDTKLAQTLARLASEQEKKFAALGLF